MDDELIVDLITSITRGKFVTSSDYQVLVNFIVDTVTLIKGSCDKTSIKNAIEGYYSQCHVPKDLVKNICEMVLLNDEYVNHSFEIHADKYIDETFIRREKRVKYLKSVPQPEQKSVEWLEMRKSCLTATKIASVINEDKNEGPFETLMDKCGRGVPFSSNMFTHHGVKYEPIANAIYAYRHNVEVEEYGLLIHEKYSFIGASPDGICDSHLLSRNGLSKIVGRLLEIKCPKLRVIQTEGELDGDIVPHYYWVQVQMQLEVTDLDECDFLQCSIDEYASREEFIEDTYGTTTLSKEFKLEKGAIIQLLPKKFYGLQSFDEMNNCKYSDAKYIYPPKIRMTNEEVDAWVVAELSKFGRSELAKTYFFDKVIYWKLKKIACDLIIRDREWFKKKLPTIKQFWKYVMFLREHPKYIDKVLEYKNSGRRSTAELMYYVNELYNKKNPDKPLDPIHQEPIDPRYSKKKYTPKSEDSPSSCPPPKINLFV